MNNLFSKTLVVMTILLSGCTYGSQFDCPVGEGNKCSSISENVKKIDAGFYKDKHVDSLTERTTNVFYFREDF